MSDVDGNWRGYPVQLRDKRPTIPHVRFPMAEVLLFHHAQGLTPGVVAFADELRAAGHTVHTPDLFDGRTFGSIDEGMDAHQGDRVRRAAGARRPDGGRPPERARLRRLLVRRDDRAEARPDPARRARRAALLLRASRSAASGRSDPGRTASRSRSTAWTTTRSSSARATSTRRARSSRSRRRRAVPLPGRPALLRRQLAPVLRPGGDGPPHGARPRVPRARLIGFRPA